MRAALSVLAILLVAWPAHAQRKIAGDHDVRPGGFAVLRVEGAGKTVLWTVTPNPIQEEEIGGSLVFTGQPGGEYTATAIVIDFEAKTAEKLRHAVRFAGSTPPPGPGPTPPDTKPPDPGPAPTPTVNPFPGVSGLHLLIVYESGELQNYPREQINSWLSREVAEYLKAKGADNWRRWDKDVDTSGAADKWKGPFMRARRESLPWVAVGNGTAGYEGPAPKTHAELMALLRRFGEGK